MIIVHACTIIIVHACIMIIVHACNYYDHSTSFGYHLDIIWMSFEHHLDIIWTSFDII